MVVRLFVKGLGDVLDGSLLERGLYQVSTICRLFVVNGRLDYRGSYWSGDYATWGLPSGSFASFPTQHQVVYLLYFGPKPKTLKSTGGCIEDHTDVVISL